MGVLVQDFKSRLFLKINKVLQLEYQAMIYGLYLKPDQFSTICLGKAQYLHCMSLSSCVKCMKNAVTRFKSVDLGLEQVINTFC